MQPGSYCEVDSAEDGDIRWGTSVVHGSFEYSKVDRYEIVCMVGWADGQNSRSSVCGLGRKLYRYSETPG